MKKKSHKIKKKMLGILKSYKTIIYISFIINIILLVFCNYIIKSNKIYSFSGSDDYITINSGIINLNNDINILYGNDIMYSNATDYDITNYKIGYYVMENKKLVSIISNTLSLDTPIKLSELINNFNSFNVAEKNNNPVYFTSKNKKLLNKGLYLVLEAKTVEEKTILSKVKINLTKISKY